MKKKKLCYLGAFLLSLLVAVGFGILFQNRNTPAGASWDIHWGLALGLFFGILIPLAFLIETLDDKASFQKDFCALGRYKYLLGNLVSRDIKTKYRRSVLGLLWSVLNPLLMMAVLTVIFANIIRAQITTPGGYALFYLVGYLVFSFVSEATTLALTSVLGAAPLIKKVYVPKYIFPLEKCLYSMVNMLFSMIAFVIVFIVFACMGRITPQFSMLLFPLPVIYVFFFALGLSLIVASLNIFFRDVAHLYSIFLTVWMYATPILFPVDILPVWLQSIVRFNPLTHYVSYFRKVLLYGEFPSLEENLICILFSVLFLLLGITVFRKNQDKFILHM